MKKKVFLLVFIIALAIFTTTIYAAGDNFNFAINYTGNIMEGEAKDAVVVLEGTDATVYSNALIKVELVSGPSTPKITAKDTSGIEYNIMELGYWGPPGGFAVGNTFKNETPVIATYSDPGTYVIRLSLIDKNSSDRVIVSQEFTQVVEAAPVSPEPVENTVVNETTNIVEEIPQTGTSIWTYFIIAVIIACIIYGINLIIKKQK